MDPCWRPTLPPMTPGQDNAKPEHLTESSMGKTNTWQDNATHTGMTGISHRNLMRTLRT